MDTTSSSTTTTRPLSSPPPLLFLNTTDPTTTTTTTTIPPSPSLLFQDSNNNNSSSSNTTIHHTSSSTDSSESMKELAVRGVLTGLLGIGCGLLAFGLMVAGFYIYRWFRFRRYLAVMDRWGILVQRRQSALQERIHRRYETVEHWLITKSILPHDEFCQRVCCQIVPNSPPLCDNNSDNDNKNNKNKTEQIKESADTDKGQEQGDDTDLERGQESFPAENAQQPGNEAGENKQEEEEQEQPSITYFTPRPDDEWDEEKECPICMNPFCHHDIVSWSANPHCSHVFHHQCIKEWLLRKTGCPFCRETFLPCDSERGRAAKKEQLSEMSKRYASRHSTSYYCFREGLVVLPPTVRCTLTELETLKDRIFDSSCAPKDLVSLRGEREEGTISQLSAGGGGAKQPGSNNDADNGDDDCDVEVAGMDHIEEPSENPDMGDDLMLCMATSSSSGVDSAVTTTTTTTTNGNLGRFRRKETSSALTADDEEEAAVISDTASSSSSTSSGPSDSAEENV